MSKRFVPAAGAVALVLVLCPVVRAASVEEQLAKAGKATADLCLKRARAAARRRLYFTAQEYLLAGLAYRADHKELLRFKKSLSFVPAFHGLRLKWALDGQGLPSASQLARRRHDRDRDKQAILAFFREGFDAIRCEFYEKVLRIKGDKDEIADKVGRRLVALLTYRTRKQAENQFWTDPKVYSTDKFDPMAEAWLIERGWAKAPAGSWEGSTEPWSSPAQAKRKRERKDFEARRNALAAKKLSALRRFVKADKVDGESSLERDLGVRLAKWRSKHFRVEAVLPDAKVRESLEILEAGFEELCRLLQTGDPGRPKRMGTLAVVGSWKRFDSYVRNKVDLPPDKKKIILRHSSFHHRNKGIWITWQKDLNLRLRDDMLAGALPFSLVDLGYARLPVWAKTGLLQLVSFNVLGTMESFTVTFQKTTGRQESGEWYDYLAWRDKMKKAEAEGTAPSMHAILERSNLNELVNIQKAKIFCLVDFLARKELPRFKKVLAACQKKPWKRDADGEYAPLKEAGWTIQGLEAAYRAHMLAEAGKKGGK